MEWEWSFMTNTVQNVVSNDLNDQSHSKQYFEQHLSLKMHFEQLLMFKIICKIFKGTF